LGFQSLSSSSSIDLASAAGILANSAGEPACVFG
jgi:hypothetical protein